MATFNDFVQTELPLRPFVAVDGNAGQTLVRSTNPLAPRELVWADAVGGALTRQTILHKVSLIAVNGVASFTLDMGHTCMILGLSVDKPCLVNAYSVASMSDTNPYTFIATPDHLSDDGSTLMSDGTVLRGRRFITLSNLDPVLSSNQYFTITNLDTANDLINVSITIDYLPIEA